MAGLYQGIASGLKKKWRLGFEGARLPAAPALVLNDLRHGWKPCPSKLHACRFSENC
jgi:hypothetical protein